MKCPYHKCRKDYNDESWPKVMDSWLSPPYATSINERSFYNRLFIVTRQCRFCNQLFHEIYVGHENFGEPSHGHELLEPTRELLVSYPFSKTKLEAKNVPKEVMDSFNEAERCRSVGSLTGSGGCLRKVVYSLCDHKGAVGSDYREKISNLPVSEVYKDCLTQIKWLGDNITKPGEEKYTMGMVDVALEILPVLIDDMYIKDEKVSTATRLLAKARSGNSVAMKSVNNDVKTSGIF